MKKNNVGIDLVFIPKFQLKINKDDNLFLKKAFSLNELEEANGDVKKLAGKFACKEAFVKILGEEKFRLNEIEVLKKDNRPYVLHCNKKYYNVSISHDGDYAVAIVIR